jgi:hypothetical protein
MGQIWIINVLTDLKTFASRNDLPLLAQQLEDCARVARVEISEMPEEEAAGARQDGFGTRTISGTGGAGTRAL